MDEERRRVDDAELEDQEGWLLPDREAMSIMTMGSTMPLPDVDSTAYAPAGDASDTAATAGEGATDAAGTSADASGSGTESVTSGDRSETISQSDTAYAES